MVFMRKWMVESPFETVLRCFENVLRRNVPTSGLKVPDVGTFLYNICGTSAWWYRQQFWQKVMPEPTTHLAASRSSLPPVGSVAARLLATADRVVVRLLATDPAVARLLAMADPAVARLLAAADPAAARLLPPAIMETVVARVAAAAVVTVGRLKDPATAARICPIRPGPRLPSSSLSNHSSSSSSSLKTRYPLLSLILFHSSIFSFSSFLFLPLPK